MQKNALRRQSTFLSHNFKFNMATPSGGNSISSKDTRNPSLPNNPKPRVSSVGYLNCLEKTETRMKTLILFSHTLNKTENNADIKHHLPVGFQEKFTKLKEIKSKLEEELQSSESEDEEEASRNKSKEEASISIIDLDSKESPRKQNVTININDSKIEEIDSTSTSEKSLDISFKVKIHIFIINFRRKNLKRRNENIPTLFL